MLHDRRVTLTGEEDIIILSRSAQSESCQTPARFRIARLNSQFSEPSDDSYPAVMVGSSGNSTCSYLPTRWVFLGIVKTIQDSPTTN